MNEFLAAAPLAVPFASRVGLMTSLDDHADRPGRGLADGEAFSTGKKTWRWIDTPHVPHGWDCGVLFDQTTGTLLCGDLFTQAGAETVPVTESEILTAGEAMRKPMDYYAHSTRTATILERLASLDPTTLACQHGSAFRGDGAGLLRDLAKILEAEQQAHLA
jgi:flavorubredoxin